jgi:hygromycin-B 7''-O-kinase
MRDTVPACDISSMETDSVRFLPIVTTWEQWCRIFTDITLWEPAIREICRIEGIPVTTVSPGFPGSNAVFLLDDKMVIKISPPQYHDDHRNELEIGRVLGNRIPIPKVLMSGVFHDRIDWPWFIMEFKPGLAAREIRNRIERENWLEICREAGAITREFHATALSELKYIDTTREGWAAFVESRRTDVINELTDAGVPESSVFNEIRALIAEFPFPESPLVLVNADLTEDHFLLVEQGGIWRISSLIDLADGRVATVPYEWPALWFGLIGQDKESLVAFLEAYDPAIRADADFRRALLAYSLLHRFCWRCVRDILIVRGPTPGFSLENLLDIVFWKEAKE